MDTCNKLSKIQRSFIFIIGLYFVLIMHYFQANPGGSGLDTANNPLGWIIISLLIGLALLQISSTGQIKISTLFKLASIGCGLMLIPVFYDLSSSSASHPRLLGLAAGLALLFAIDQMNFTKHNFRSILWLILIGVLIESCFSLIQYFILPFQSFLIIDTTMTRPAAVFFQPNVAATFLVTGLIISLHLRQSSKEQLSKFQQIIVTAVPFLSSMAIVILQSRTGFLAAIIGIAILIWSNKSKHNRHWLTLVIAGTVTAIVAINVLNTPTRDASIYTKPGIRTLIYQTSLALIKQQPLTGHGYGKFEKAFVDYEAGLLVDQPQRPIIRNLSHPHNEILYWGVEGGIVAIFGLLVIVAGVTWQLFRLPLPIAGSYFALLMPLALHSMTEYPFYHAVASWIVFILLLGYSNCAQQLKTYQLTVNSQRPYQLLATLIVLITTIYMLTTLQSQQVVMKYLINQQASTLIQAINPFSPARFQIELNQAKLDISIVNNITEGVTEYIIWANKAVSLQPRQYLFRGLIKANFYLNNLKQASYWRQQARYYFPKQQWPEISKMQLKITKASGKQ